MIEGKLEKKREVGGQKGSWSITSRKRFGLNTESLEAAPHRQAERSSQLLNQKQSSKVAGGTSRQAQADSIYWNWAESQACYLIEPRTLNKEKTNRVKNGEPKKTRIRRWPTVILTLHQWPHKPSLHTSALATLTPIHSEAVESLRSLEKESAMDTRRLEYI
jgi:hypothetical protein